MLLISAVGFGCRSDETASADAVERPYTFEDADAVLALPGELAEVSGLAVLGQDLLAIQDENGTVFHLDPREGKILNSWALAGKGDFEDIVLAGDVLYLLQSNGKVIRARNWQNPERSIDTLEFDVSGSCDAEALAIRQDSLLLACKDDPGKAVKNGTAIFQLGVADDTSKGRIKYVLPYDSLHATAFPGQPRSIESKFKTLAEGDLDLRDFRPSAMAFHPVTNELYILSSGAKALVVLSPQGVIRNVFRLPEDRFPQPEGMIFMPDGTLYLSNEGGTGDATLLRFPYKSRKP